MLTRRGICFLWVICSCLPLFCADSGVPPKAGKKDLTAHLTLAVVDSVVVKSEFGHIFIDPIKCDNDGNIYRLIGIEATDGIRELSPKGRRMATFVASSATDLPVWHATYFSVNPDGSVYQLADLRGMIDRAVIMYNKDGSYKSDVRLDAPPGFREWLPSQIAGFPSGDFLIAGSKSDPDTHVRIPFTAIFASNGTLQRQIVLQDDEDMQKLAELGDPRAAPPDHPFSNWAVELGQMASGDDGNVYMMRRLSPAVFSAVSSGGEVVRRFTVDPGSSDLIPLWMQIAGMRIAVMFWDEQTQKQLIKIVDLEGREIATYQDPVNSGAGALGAVACYSQNPERFTFLFTADDGYLGFRIAEPR